MSRLKAAEPKQYTKAGQSVKEKPIDVSQRESAYKLRGRVVYFWRQAFAFNNLPYL
jgi:hypothetical protein